jgi:hypothetical protein
MGQLVAMIVLSLVAAIAMAVVLRTFLRRIRDIQRSHWGDDV